MFFNFEFGPPQRKIKLETRTGAPLFGYGDQERWAVWSYAGLLKGQSELVRPDVMIGFRKLQEDELGRNASVGDKIVYKRLGIQLLGQLSIGTVLKEDSCIGALKFKRKEFVVDFNEGSWVDTSFEDALEGRAEPPYPYELWPIENPSEPHIDDRGCSARFLKFPIREGAKSSRAHLIVPALEFLSRTYGRSQEIKRILTTYPWDGEKGARARLYSTPVDPAAAVPWGVHLGKKLVYDDAVYVAHVKEDPYAERVSRRLFDEFRFFYKANQNRSRLFTPPVAPWFQGLARIEVLGRPIERDDASFLGLRVIGTSEPQGPTITADLWNTNKVKEKASGEGEGEGWKDSPEREEQGEDEFEEPIKLSTDTPPGRKVKSRSHLSDPPYKILGPKRRIKKVVRNKAKTSAAPRTESENVDKSAPGERTGHDVAVGHVSISAKSIGEKSDGQLSAMWNSMLALRDDPKSPVETVELYDGKGYSEAAAPRVISFEFKSESNDDEASRPKPSWFRVGDRDRYAIHFRARVEEEWIYFLDIERRPKDHFAALAFMLDEDFSSKGGDIMSWLSDRFSRLSNVKGVLSNLLKDFPGLTRPYPHRESSKEGEKRFMSVLRHTVTEILKSKRVRSLEKAGTRSERSTDDEV